MRKSVFILLAIVLCFVLIVSCNDSPAGGGSEPAPTDNMTESYRNARKVFHDSTSIWLPELEGVEVADADIEITKTDYKPLINLSFAGNEELFNQLVALFTSVIGNPDSNMSNETFKFWEAEYIDGGQLYMGNTSVSLLGENKDKIAMHGHFFRAFTVTLNANPAAGGTVKIDQAGTDYGTTITSTEGSDIDLVATAADGYEFAGWYLGDTKLSDKANFMDYKVPSSNVTIEGRFTEQETTAYYAALQGVFSKVFGVTLPSIADIDATEYAAEDAEELNGITTASELKTWISGPSGTTPAYVVNLVGEDEAVASACVTILDAFNGFVEADSTHWRNSGEELSLGSGYYSAYYCTEDSLGEWTFQMAVMVYTEGDVNYPSIDFNIFYPSEP